MLHMQQDSVLRFIYLRIYYMTIHTRKNASTYWSGNVSTFTYVSLKFIHIANFLDRTQTHASKHVLSCCSCLWLQCVFSAATGRGREELCKGSNADIDRSRTLTHTTHSITLYYHKHYHKIAALFLSNVFFLVEGYSTFKNPSITHTHSLRGTTALTGASRR
jgi:hypothetical protein